MNKFKIKHQKKCMKKYDIEKFDGMIGGYYIVLYKNHTSNVTLIEKCQMNCKGFQIMPPFKNN